MLVLALDTTTRGGSVAVTRQDEPLAVVQGDPARTHGEHLPAMIERALTLAGVSAHDLHLLAVARGPGAFTGLRIGLATVQGLAMVLQCPVAGVSALDALAADVMQHAGAPAGCLAAWMDAQRGEVFAATYRADAGTLQVLQPPIVGRPADVIVELRACCAETITFTGDGALRYDALISETLGERASVPDGLRPLAPAVARLGRRAALEGRAGAPHLLQPLYVRRPDAELDRMQGQTR